MEPQRGERIIALTALGIGVFILSLGLLGLAAPQLFLQTVSFFQSPPVIFLAAVLRVAVGATLVVAAPLSRAPMPMRVIGAFIFAGGVFTPFIGVEIGKTILGWWISGGPVMIRIWAGMGMVLGGLIVWAMVRGKRQINQRDDLE
jgi:hypothetical protein